jgi:hypothetical protein
VADLEHRVAAVAAAWPPDVVFECSGPWAPSHFVVLELQGGVECES